MAIQLGSAYGKITIDSNGVTVGVGNATKSLGTLSQVASKIGDSMIKIGGAMTVGLTLPLLAFGAAAVKEAAESEAALADLDAVIKSTGKAAGVTADAVKEYASKMQMLTKFSDDQIISGNAMLLTFTNIGKEVFPLASDATLDLAQKFGMDLSQASIMLGKALNDPIAGVGALRRIGVQLSDEQEKQIKRFMELNDVASAQKVILGELTKEIGGSAEAYGKTFAGQLQIFNHRLDAMKEKIGVQLIPSLIRFMDALTPLLEWFANASPATIDFIIALMGIVAAAGPVTTAIGGIVKVIGVFLPGGALSGVATFFSATLLPALGTFFTFITATAIPAIVAFTVANAAWIVPLLAVAVAVGLLYLAWKKNFLGMQDMIKQLGVIIPYYFNKMMISIGDAFKKINWSQLGKWMLIGLANGMLGGIPMIVATAWKAGKAAYEAMKAALDARSPSKKFQKLGEFAGQGFSIGLVESLTNMKADLNKSLEVQLNFFSSYFKDVNDMNKQNTKSHADSMMAQTRATVQALAMQAAAMAKYKAAAAAFWSGKGIPIGQASSNLNNSASSLAPYMEQITKPGWDPSVMTEQVKPVNVEATNPVKVEVNQNFSTGVTVHQAQQMIKNNTESIYKTLTRAMGGV